MDDLLNVRTNERVDLADFDFMSDESRQLQERQLFSSFMLDPAAPMRVVSGFAMDNPSGTQVRVTKGIAVLGQREGALTFSSLLTVEGDATKIVDVGSFSAGTYGIFVRFEFVDGDQLARTFWNPSGNGSEFSQTIPTKRQANWSMRIETSSPGAEWFKIGETTEAAAITDQRDFYFEGDIAGGTIYESGWSTEGGGSANDRNADRQQFGVFDLQTFTAATRQLFEDLRPTGGRWWEKRGLKATGLAASNEPGFDGIGDGSGAGVRGVGGDTNGSWGLQGAGASSAATNSGGTLGTGKGTGVGVRGEASGDDNTSVGVEGVGDISGAATSSNGVKGTGAGTAGRGVVGQAAGTGPGVEGLGAAAANSVGVKGFGGTSSGSASYGGHFIATQTQAPGARGEGGPGAPGFDGIAGTSGGSGVRGTGDTTGFGVEGIGGASGDGVKGSCSGTGRVGVRGDAATGANPGTGVVGSYLGSTDNDGIGVHGTSLFRGRALIAENSHANRATVRFVPQASPEANTSLQGDLYVNTSGVLRICTVAGSPGTWVNVGAQ